MKAGLVTLSALLAGTVAAQPHHAHRRHPHVQNEKRAYQTVVEYKTLDNPTIEVYVDQNGNPLYTKTEYAPGTGPTSSPDPVAVTPEAVESTPTPQPAPASTSSSSEAYVPAPSSSSLEVSSYTPPPAPPSSSAAPAPSSSSAPAPSASAPSTGDGFGLGVSYSPYVVNGCKDTAAVLSDFQAMTDYSVVRLYGTDCNQVANGIAAAKATNKKLILGVYKPEALNDELTLMKNGVNGAWDLVQLVTIGNEDVNRGTAVQTMVDAVNNGRATLRADGYSGPVSTVDTFDKIIANPALCQASDIATANCHAFFTDSINAAGAGQYVHDRMEDVKKACGGKQTIITESGWPWQGDRNGAAIPSKANQATAIAGLKSAFGNANIVLFSAFNDNWKTDFAGSFNAEKYWGMLG